CFLDLFLAFSDALFHQLLVAMAHPDRETQIGAHSVFSMLWPSSKPDSISQIKKQELTVEKMNRDIRDKIKEKISEKDYVASGMRSSYYWKMEWRRRIARKGKILSNLEIIVQFNADIADGMPWKFTPTQREVRVKPGESALAFYTAENKSSTPITDFASHEEIMEILATVAADLGDVIDVSFLQVKPLKGAMTNEVFEINWPAKSDGHLRRVLVRLYGEGVEVFFNRDVEDEIQTFESMSKHGQGPCLLGRFATGRVEEFIHARFHVIRTRTETCRKKVRSLEQMNGNLLLELVQEGFMHIWLMDADSCPFFKKEFS
ncbi:hypothetical protein S83_055211, partial [Arachis hypogaea]